jgi:hypothetical protein
MSEQEKELKKKEYVIIETVNYEKCAPELSIIIMGKWLEANLPGTEEAKPMKDG